MNLRKDHYRIEHPVRTACRGVGRTRGRPEPRGSGSPERRAVGANAKAGGPAWKLNLTLVGVPVPGKVVRRHPGEHRGRRARSLSRRARFKESSEAELRVRADELWPPLSSAARGLNPPEVAFVSQAVAPTSFSVARCCRFAFRDSSRPSLVRPLPGRSGETLAPAERRTTLSGGSLGSCVDEERSQLRELM